MNKVRIPRSLSKLIRKGVLVRVSCLLDCRVVATVKVPKKVAKRMGLKKPLIARKAAFAKAGQPIWVRAKLSKRARRAFRTSYTGGGRLKVRLKTTGPGQPATSAAIGN